MPPRLSPDAQTALLSAVLDVLREQDRPVLTITIDPTGLIELRLDPEAASQRFNELDRWRARRRAKARRSSEL